MSWYHVRGVTKEKPEVVELYNKKYARGRYDGPADHIVFLPVQVSKVVAEGYVGLLQVSIVNSYILYTTTRRQLGQQPQSHLQFCREFILQFVAHRLQLPPPSCFGSHVDLSLERLRPVTHFSEESERRWDCRVCSVVGRSHTTSYFCVTCSDRTHLHPGRCFRLYHTRENFRQ